MSQNQAASSASLIGKQYSQDNYTKIHNSQETQPARNTAGTDCVHFRATTCAKHHTPVLTLENIITASSKTRNTCHVMVKYRVK